MKNISKKAFSLVELSIVLIIVALLVAAVSGGKELILASKRQKLITDLDEILKSLKAFDLTYNALPGDFKSGQQFFGSSNCPDHGSISALDCDGDGNREIGSIYTSEGAVYEHQYVYFHMQLAGIYKGYFAPSTIGTSMGNWSVEDKNTPSFEVDGAKGYFAFWGDDTARNNNFTILMGAITPSGDDKGKPYAGAITARTVTYIDQKLDNGNISTGQIKKRNAAGLTCGTNLQDDALNCGMYYIDGSYE